MTSNKNKVPLLLSENSDSLIWKIKLDDTNEIMVWECRSLAKKLSFYAYNFVNETYLLKDFCFDEDWLLGLDFIYDSVVYFHGFESEFSPVHKGIIAYDLNKNEIIWQNFSVSSQQYVTNGVIVFDPKIFPRTFQMLEGKTGNLISKIELENLYQTNSIYNQIEIPQLIEQNNIWDTTHQLNFNDLKIVSFYRVDRNKTSQYLQVYKNENLIYEDLLGEDIQKLSIDTFFVWLGKLIYIRNKSEILSYLV